MLQASSLGSRYSDSYFGPPFQLFSSTGYVLMAWAIVQIEMPPAVVGDILKFLKNKCLSKLDFKL